MNQHSDPVNLEDFKYCYRRDQGPVGWLLIIGAVLGYCSYLLTQGDHAEAIFLWGLTAFVIFRAFWVLIDNTVKFGFNEDWLFTKGKWIRTDEIDSHQVTEKRDGARLQYFLKLSLKDGRQERIELTNLEKSAKDVLMDMSEQFDVTMEEQL